jgi:hypothetical protein
LTVGKRRRKSTPLQLPEKQNNSEQASVHERAIDSQVSFEVPVILISA